MWKGPKFGNPNLKNKGSSYKTKVLKVRPPKNSKLGWNIKNRLLSGRKQHQNISEAYPKGLSSNKNRGVQKSKISCRQTNQNQNQITK